MSWYNKRRQGTDISLVLFLLLFLRCENRWSPKETIPNEKDNNTIGQNLVAL